MQALFKKLIPDSFSENDVYLLSATESINSFGFLKLWIYEQQLVKNNDLVGLP